MKHRTWGCLVLLALGFTSCSTMVRQRIPRPDSFAMSNRKHYITMKSGATHTAYEIKVANDTAYFNDTNAKLSDIKTIETKKFSPGKTIALTAAIVLSAAVLIPFTIAFMLATGHSN